MLKRNFVNPNEINECLNCQICLEVFDDPWRSDICAHVYCKACINDWITNHDKNCPMCRIELTLKDLHKDILVSNIIDDFEVKCEHL